MTDVIKLRISRWEYNLGLSEEQVLNPTTNILISDAHGRKPRDHRGRGWSKEVTGQGVSGAARGQRKRSQAKACLELPEARGSKERMVPGDFRESTALPTPWFQASDLQNFEKVNAYCFKPPSSASLNFETAYYSTLGTITWICLLGDEKLSTLCVCVKIHIRKVYHLYYFKYMVQWY